MTCQLYLTIADFFPRHMEDFVTWVDTSRLKRTVMRYNDEVRFISLIFDFFLRVLMPFQLDDFDLL